MSDSALFPQLWPATMPRRAEPECVGHPVAAHYRAHYPAVKRYAYAIVRCSYEAEDVAQEAFVRLIQTLERGQELEAPLPWLLRVAHNVAVSRVSGTASLHPFDECQEAALADRQPNPEEAACAKQRRDWLQEALSRLSPQELRCWTLRAEGLRYREIAEILEIRTGTVATLLVRAAEKLSAACPDRAEPWATAAPSLTEGPR